MMKRAVILLSVSSLVFASSTVYLLARLADQRQEPAALQKRAYELERTAKPSADTSAIPVDPQLRGRSPQIGTTVSKAPDYVAALIAGAPAEPTVEEVVQAVESGLIARQSNALRDPRFRVAFIAYQKENLWLAHADALNALQLSPEVADLLMELLVEHQVQWSERPVGMPSDTDMFDPAIDPERPPLWLLRRRQEEQRRKNEIEALLGEAKYREWTNYQETAGARREVALLDAALEASGDPLTSDKRRGLVHAIAEKEARKAIDLGATTAASIFGSREGAGRATNDAVERIARSNDHLRQVAASYLSASQLRVYEDVLARRLAYSQASN